jgi:hypothetical protein
MQQPPDDESQELLQPDTEIPVKLESLEADGTRPKVGDSVTIKIDGTVKSIEKLCLSRQTRSYTDTEILNARV